MQAVPDRPLGQNILKPSPNWSLFKLIISDQTLIRLKLFLPIYVHFNWQTVSSVFEQFFFTSKVFGLNCKIDGFESSFFL